jgi:LPXTG-motif cell wall-anchored protein
VAEVVLVRKFFTLRRGPTGRTRVATVLAAVGALVMSGGVVMLGASTAAADPDPCVPQPAYTETINHPAVTHVVHHDAVTHVVHHAAVPATPDLWWNWSPNDTQGPQDYVPAFPTDTRGTWQGPHENGGPDQDTYGTFNSSNANSGNSSWFHREHGTAEVPAYDETVVDHPAYDETVVDHPAWTETVYHPAVTCDTTVTIGPPAAPSTTDPCGPANISFNVPADTAQLDYTLLTNGDVTVAPQPGYVFSGATQLVTFTLPADSGVPCPLAAEEIEPVVTFTNPTCAALDGADWSGTLGSIVKYQVSGTPDLGESVAVTASIKPAYAGEYVFPDGFDATFEHTYPTLAELDCVLGEETVVPSPKPQHKPPVVLGTEAAVPTGVEAGLASLPNTGATGHTLLAQLMVGSGLVLLVAGGWLGFSRREYGGHQL